MPDTQTQWVQALSFGDLGMSINTKAEQEQSIRDPKIEAAWFVHVALQRYAQEQPEAAENHYFQIAMEEALAGYRFAMGAK
ncbi:MAG: hypothetical protein ACRCVX_12350 [Shewanella sp.]